METIRQNCPQCRSTLELPTSAIGRMARCPACQHTFRVSGEPSGPSQTANATGDRSSSSSDPLNFGVPNAGRPANQPGSNPGSPESGQSGSSDIFGSTPEQPSKPQPTYGSPAYTGNPYAESNAPVSTSYDNPYAFSPGMASSAALQVDKSPIEVRTASIDQIISTSFNIFSARWQPLVLSGLVYFVVVILVAILNGAATAFVQASGIDFGPLLLFVAGTVISVFSWYFLLGLINVALLAARGQETGPSQMFLGLNTFGRLLILIVALAIIGSLPNLFSLFMGPPEEDVRAAMATMIGALFVGLLTGLFLWTIWPIFFLVVDGRSEEGGGLGLAFKIGTRNLLNAFLMGLFFMVLGIAATCTCLLGNIVTQPLTMLIGAVGYLMMTSQPISDPNQMQYTVPGSGNTQ